MNVTLGASESFNQRNGNASLGEAKACFEDRNCAAREDHGHHQRRVRLPFEGRVEPAVVSGLVEHARRLGAEDRPRGHDRRRHAAPGARTRRADERGRLPRPQHSQHGFANAYAALEAGATTLDASVGGLGGCPFAPRATGNIATEDLVYMLEGDSVETGVDLDALIAISEWLEERPRPAARGQVYRAGSFSGA